MDILTFLPILIWALYSLTLIKKNEKLINAIKEHQANTGHELCWLNDLKLWQTIDPAAKYPHNTLPVKDEFLTQCKKYYESRLDGSNYKSPRTPATINNS